MIQSQNTHQNLKYNLLPLRRIRTWHFHIDIRCRYSLQRGAWFAWCHSLAYVFALFTPDAVYLHTYTDSVPHQLWWEGGCRKGGKKSLLCLFSRYDRPSRRVDRLWSLSDRVRLFIFTAWHLLTGSTGADNAAIWELHTWSVPPSRSLRLPTESCTEKEEGRGKSHITLCQLRSAFKITRGKVENEWMHSCHELSERFESKVWLLSKEPVKELEQKTQLDVF